MMTVWRAFLVEHRRLALWLVGLALLVRAVVPAGYMLMPSEGRILLSICSGQGAQMIALPPGAAGGEQGDHRPGDKPDHPCVFSGLGLAATDGADLSLLAVALAYIVALGILPIAAPRRQAPTRLRPPLRAPPLLR